MAPPGSEVIVVDNVDTEQDGKMEDSVPEEADNGAGVGDIIFDEQEGRVPARKTAKIPAPTCPATHLPNVLVQTLPDSKIVEDARNKIRNDSLLNKTRKQTNSTIQTVIENSNVFESRSIRHPAKVKRNILKGVGSLGMCTGSGRDCASDLVSTCRQSIPRLSVTRHGTLCQKRHSSEHQLRGHG